MIYISIFIIGVAVGLVWGKWPAAPEEKKKEEETLGSKIDVLA